MENQLSPSPFKKRIIRLQALVPRVWEECGLQYRYAHGLCHVFREENLKYFLKARA